MAEQVRQYVAIDAKSFYASVECVERHLNPLTTNLVVADESRTEKTICLAVSPALKAHGVPGRPRLFEVIQRVRDVNRERMNAGIRSGAIKRNPETKKYQFSSASFDAEAIESDPTLEVSYIIAPPRMRLYEEYSSRIYATYLKYVAPEDIIDVTNYLHTYADIIHLPHHKAPNRPHMSLYDRAAQFSPFAALTGFDGVIAETARLTDRKVKLSESEKILLDQKLTLIDDVIQDKHHPEITVVYFVPDYLKEGGEYEEYTGLARKIDPIERTVVFMAANGRSAGKTIRVDDMTEIHGELVDYMDD